MKPYRTLSKGVALLTLSFSLFTGCGTTEDEGGSATVSGGVYYGVGFYDPWYYGGYYPPDVIVTPPPGGSRPPGGSQPHPEHPIARPPAAPTPAPRPMPSIPSMPRPAMRR